MWNILKALNYQIKRDNVTIYAVIVGLLMSAMMFIDVNIAETDGGQFAAASGEVLSMELAYMMIILITRICGWDQTDKTINYEILSGHSRASVFFSRVTAVLIWTVPLAVIITAIPVGIVTAMNGWGQEMELKAMLIRYAFMLMPVIRLGCGYILISFLCRSFAVSAVACFLITQGEFLLYMILEELSGIEITCQLAVSNMAKLMEFNSRLGFIDGKDVYVYDASLSPEFVSGTVIFSLTASVIYIFIGYLYFTKNDMK
ncbi:MAG: hypothetical protein ACI4KF_12130 [Huintestinicola sp.]